jgi:hypothetical protein
LINSVSIDIDFFKRDHSNQRGDLFIPNEKVLDDLVNSKFFLSDANQAGASGY